MDMNQENFQKLTEIMKEIKFTMLTTVHGDGSIHSRPMLTQDFNRVRFDGSLWFLSRKSSIKNHAIENDQHVNLCYTNPGKDQYASVSGRATISEDKQKIKELWTEELKPYFPKGVDDPEMSLIRIRVVEAEIWDHRSGQMVHVQGLSGGENLPYQRPSESTDYSAEL